MKKTTFAFLLMIAAAGALAKPITLADLPTTSPPYGSYYYSYSKDTNVALRARKEVIAKHYGYPDFMTAYSDCGKESAKLKGAYECNKDVFAHVRDSHPVAKVELPKYGFKNWREAVVACEKKIERGDLEHCTYDPFLKIRGK